MQELHKLSDDLLVEAFAAGNNEAFDTLLRRHQSRVFSYILRVVKDKDVADDIFQETFIKAIMTIKQGKYSSSGKFSAWISRIAHNLIIDSFRQEKNENLVSSDNETYDMLNDSKLCEENIEDHLVKSQIHKDVRRIMKALPDSQREVLVMRYDRNMSFKEIAEATGVSINTALGRMRYAILNMRRIAKENNVSLTL